MKRLVSQQMEYVQFESFDANVVTHGIFTRKGGVSPAPWQSLNQGGTVGDERPNVVENRRRVFEAIQRPVESIYDVWQVHGVEIINTRVPRPLEADHVKADAILTDDPDVTLFMRFADCVPVLVYDPVRKVTGIIHAGWMGTVKQIVKLVIENMQQVYQCDPANIVAGIGPSIGICHYQVGENVIETVKASFGDAAEKLLPVRDGKTCFDLWEANALLLRAAGVRSVEISGLCTACHTEDWYSHRAEAGKTGRFGAVLCLNGENRNG